MDADTVSATINNQYNIDSMLYKTSSLEENQTIKDFLAKPRLFAGGVFGPLDGVSTFSSFVSPTNILNNDLFLDKIRGFLGFRATVVFRLTVNANKFQQGRYMLCYVPTGGASPASAAGMQRYLSHTNTLTQRTQLPRVEIDLSCDTEAVLRVPYNSALNYYTHNPADAYGAWGRFQIFPYSPLVAPSGSTTAPYTLFIHFEDVELISATVPQSGRFMKGSKGPSEREAESKGVGPISAPLMKVSKSAAILAEIPFISSYATNLSWMTNIMSNAASVFGWSKPRNLDAQKKTVRESFPGAYNVDVTDVGQSLSLSSQNAVYALPGFSGTDTDELDFTYLATIPAYYTQTQWNTTDVLGDVLFQTEVYPNYAVASRTVPGGIVIVDYTPVAFVSDYFSYWRGSLVYTFKLVKTGFHSGRLAVYFVPINTALPDPPINLLNSAYVHREIIDIREQNEFTVTIPFVSDTPFRRLTGSDAAIGNLYVTVLAPLTGPDTVSSTITLLVEKSGGPDIEFAVPFNNRNTPVYGATPQSSSFMQGAKGTKNVCSIQDYTIGSSSIKHDPVINSAACIGEKISSFRTLLKSTDLINYNTIPSFSKFTFVKPFAYPYFLDNGSEVFHDEISDLYGTLCSIYAYSRGGVRLKFMIPATTSQSYSSVTQLIQGTFGIAATSSSVISSSGNNANGGASAMIHFNGYPYVFHHNGANRSIEVSVPQYTRTHSRVNWDNALNDSSPVTVSGANFFDQNIVQMSTPGATPGQAPYVFRGGADDCNFGLFVSIPPMQKSLGYEGQL